MKDFGVLSLFLCLFLCSNAYKLVIFVPNLANSQTQFSVRVGEALANGGHDVTLVLETYLSGFKTDVKAPKGVKFYHLNAYVEGITKEIIERDMASGMFEDLGLMGTPKLMRMFGNITRVMSEGCRLALRDKEFLNWLKAEKFDLAYASAVSTCDIGLIHAAGIPTWAWLNSGPLVDHVAKSVGVPIIPSYVPAMLMESTDEMTFLQRTKSWVGHAMTMPMYRKMFTDGDTRMFREELNDPNFPDTYDLAAKCPLVFVNTNEMYDFPRPTLAKIVNIGGLGVGFDSAKPLVGKFKELSETGKGLVIFSFGSVAGAHEMPLAWKNALLESFRSFPDYQFVMRYVADDLNDRLPKNVYLSKWLPQKDLLLHDHTKAFITHGGYNSMQEAISAGMPLVTIALGGDQPKNAQLARKLGIAVNIAKSTISKETVTAALQEVLTNLSYKEKAQLFSAMVRAQPVKPAERLVRWSEFLAEFKTLDHLRPAGQQLNFLQYHSFDVIGFLITISLFVLFLAYRMLRWLTRKISKILCRKSTKSKHD